MRGGVDCIATCGVRGGVGCIPTCGVRGGVMQGVWAGVDYTMKRAILNKCVRSVKPH